MTVDFINVKTNLSLFFNSKCYSSKCVCLLRFPPNKYDNPFRIPCDILYEPKTLFQSECQMVCNILYVCKINVINSITRHSSTSQLQKSNIFFHRIWVALFFIILSCILVLGYVYFRKQNLVLRKQITKLLTSLFPKS